MGSGQSSVKAPEEQKPETGTTLFGSWDKPVADAYKLKKQVSKNGKAAVKQAADAAGAAVNSAIQMEAGAGVKPPGTKASAGRKSQAAGQGWPFQLSISSACVTITLATTCLQ